MSASTPDSWRSMPGQPRTCAGCGEPVRISKGHALVRHAAEADLALRLQGEAMSRWFRCNDKLEPMEEATPPAEAQVSTDGNWAELWQDGLLLDVFVRIGK